jgi:hypothetical protein
MSQKIVEPLLTFLPSSYNCILKRLTCITLEDVAFVNVILDSVCLLQHLVSSLSLLLDTADDF